MAYQGNIAPVPIGNMGLVKLDNRNQHKTGELIVAEGLTFEDNSTRTEMGAVAYDAAGLLTSPAYASTASVLTAWNAHLLAVTGSAIAVAGTATFGDSGAAASGVTCLAPVGGYAIGTLVLVYTVVKGTFTIGTCVDTVGNIYTAAGPTVQNPFGPSSRLWYTIVTVNIPNGASIVTTWTGTSTATQLIGNFSGISAIVSPPYTTAIGVGTAVAVGPTAPPASVPYLLIGATGDTNGATFAPGLGYTELVERTRPATLENASLNYRLDTSAASLIAMYDWHSEIETVPAGTATIVQGSATVTGAGTTFTNHAPGDIIVINFEQHIISSITNNALLVTTEPWSQSVGPVAYSRRVGGRIISSTTGGNLLKEKPTTLTTGNLDDITLAAGLSRTARPGVFVQAGKERGVLSRKLFYFNGTDRVQVLSDDGVATLPIATPPLDWGAVANPLTQPVAGIVHDNRLVAWGNLNSPHSVYFSDPDNHELFIGGSSFSMQVRTDVGERLYCAVNFQGLLVMWKYPRGIFYLDDTDTTKANWFLRAKSESLGCAPTPYAALSIDDDVLFMSSDGNIHLLSAVDTFGGTRASNLSYGLGFANWLRDNLNLARLNQVVSCWFPQKKVALFGAPGVGSLTNNLTLRFDFSGVNSGKPVLFSVSYRDNPESLTMRRDRSDLVTRPIIGEAGTVSLTEQTTRSKNGQPYTSSFQTAHDDFAYVDPTLRYRRKLWEHLALEMEPSNAAGSTAALDIYVDEVLRQQLTVDLTKRRQRFKLNVGDGYTLSFKMTCLGSAATVIAQDMNVIGASIWFRVGDEDQSR